MKFGSGVWDARQAAIEPLQRLMSDLEQRVAVLEIERSWRGDK
jgi:hypothetical protein